MVLRSGKQNRDPQRVVRSIGLCGCWLLIALGTLFAGGCGNSSKPKAESAPVATNEEEKAEAPAAPAPAKVEKKAVAAKPATPLGPRDPSKGTRADLKAGLSDRDITFVLAVLQFSNQRPNGPERAKELRGLLESAGQMKDDATVPLPMPGSLVVSSAAAPAAVPAMGPQTPATATPAPEKPASARKLLGGPRLGRGGLR
jgi:hypothetical protein